MPDYSIKYAIRTEDEERTKIVTAMWTIPNFAQQIENMNTRDIRTTPADCAQNDDEETRFQLKLEFIGREHDLIEIYYRPPLQFFLKSVLTICLKCYKERSIVMKEYQMVQPNKWQFLGVLFKKDVVNFDRNDAYLNEGSLSLKFQFMVNREMKLSPSNTQTLQLRVDLANMFKNETYADVKIKSAEGVEFFVHKAILSARSPVLRAHFCHNTVECQTNVLESPLSTLVLEEVLSYIYTDNAPKILLMPSQLLAAADFYQMNGLKQLCEDALYQNLTVDNVIEILELADLHSATGLKKKTLEYMKDGNANLIIKTRSWANLQSVGLIKTIMEYIVNDEQPEPGELL